MGTRGSAFELVVGEGSAPPPDGAGPLGQDPPEPVGPEMLRGRARRLAALPRLRLLRELDSSARGLTESEADARVLHFGENTLSEPLPPGRWRRGRTAVLDPFVLLLTVIAVVAVFTGSPIGAVVVFAGAAASCGLRIQQERRGERAAAALRAMVSATATVVRRAGPSTEPVAREIPVAGLVPGDVVRLVPGDLVPADLYLLSAADLEVSERVLTGESRPAVKIAAPAVLPAVMPTSISAGAVAHDDRAAYDNPAREITAPTPAARLFAPPAGTSAGAPPAFPWLCLAGGTVAHGTGTGVVVATGGATVFGAAHALPADRRAPGGFDRAARRVTWLLLAFTAATVPLVLALAATRGRPAPALAFALAVAVGLTPEMLPVVITTVLARAARLLAADGTVVRRLPAVHDLAAMDTLCIDKTGTLTEGRLAVTGSVDAAGEPAPAALDWAIAVTTAVTSRAPGLADAFDEALTEAFDQALAEADAAADDEDFADDFDFDVDTDDYAAHHGYAGTGNVIAIGSAIGMAAARAAALAPAAPVAAVDLQVLDVLPFDPVRRRVSALLRDPAQLGSVVLATRGAVDEVLGACVNAHVNVARPAQPHAATAATGFTTANGPTATVTASSVPLTAEDRARLLDYAEARAAEGDRLLAVAVRALPPRRAHAPLRPEDELGLTLVGFVALRDRPGAAAAGAVADLARLGVRVAVLTGDAPEVAARVCREIGLDPGRIAVGARIDACGDAELVELAARTGVFARVDPAQKARVVAALRAGGRVVGFLGDGVNDAPALRAADVGIAVRGGAELARECADVVLGDKDLACLGRAVAESRRATANAVKYLRVTISSNLGNALSVAVAVLVLPFLPMLPLQVLVQNLCFDLCQLALARDRVDPGAGARPSRLTARDPALFALVFGLLNTVADLATFAVLHRLLHGEPSPADRAAFHAGWFAENLLTQALAILLLRTRRQSWPARPAYAVAAAGLLLAGLGLALPISGAGPALSFAVPPAAFYPDLGLIAAAYVAAVVLAKAGCRKLWTV